MQLRLAWLSMPVLALALGACAEEGPPPQVPPPATAAAASAATATKAPQDIVEKAIAAGKFNTLATALTKAGLVETLKGPGPFTVFAPTDEAFAKVPKEKLDALLADKDKLTAVLTYHVVSGKVLAADAAKLTSAKTVNGKELAIKVDGPKVMVGEATVVGADVEASNGVIHIIDTVLLPEEKPEAPAKPDLLAVATEAKTFTTLADLLGKAGLVDTLKGPGPFTVFAPTDEAFKKVPKKTLEDLAKDTEKLKAVLTYHVVSGKVLAADVAKMTTAKTVQGGEIKVKADAKGVTLDGKVKVVKTDIEAGNGVIHVLDGVLMPPAAPKATAAKPATPATPAAPAGKPAGAGHSEHKGGGGGKGTGGGTGGGGGANK